MPGVRALTAATTGSITNDTTVSILKELEHGILETTLRYIRLVHYSQTNLEENQLVVR